MTTTKKKSHVTTATDHETTATTPTEIPMTTAKKKTTKSHATTATTATPLETTATTPTPDTPATPAPPAAPPAPYIAACIALVTQIQQLLPPSSALTAQEKQRSLKARKGGEQFIPQLLALAEQSGVVLKAVPLDAIRANTREVDDLTPLLTQLGLVTKQLGDRVFQMRGASWNGSTKLYTVLRRLSADDGDLAKGLAPVAAFFSYRNPVVKKAIAAKKATKKQATASQTVTPVTAPAPAPAAPAAPAMSPTPNAEVAPIVHP